VESPSTDELDVRFASENANCVVAAMASAAIAIDERDVLELQRASVALTAATQALDLISIPWPRQPDRRGAANVRVVVPFVAIHPGAEEALRWFAPASERIDVSGSIDAYWTAMARTWSDGATFVNVEHDVALHTDVFPTFEACPSLWCSFPYGELPPDRPPTPDDRAQLRVGMQLGCVRFRAELLAAHPDLVESLEPRYRDWRVLDSGIARELWRRGVEGPCQHFPPVLHFGRARRQRA